MDSTTPEEPAFDLEALLAEHAELSRAFDTAEASVRAQLYDVGEVDDTLPDTRFLEETGRKLTVKARQVERARLVVMAITAQAARPVWPVRDHHVGDLAYLDSGAGLIPCKVLRVSVPAASSDGPQDEVVTVHLTAPGHRHGAGEILTQPASAVVPRGPAYVYLERYRLRGRRYRWVHDGGDDAPGN